MRNAHVKLGASYAWSSIAGARYVLEKGLRWRVGNGLSIHIWRDKSVSNRSTHKLITPRPSHSVPELVSSLIDQELRNWKVNQLESLFMHEGVKGILSKPH